MKFSHALNFHQIRNPPTLMVFEHWEHCHVLMPVDIMHILVAKPTCLLKINLKQIFRKLKVQKQMQRN